jgi:hypothetical protein
MQSNSRTAAITTGVVGSIIAAIVVAALGIGASEPTGVIIDGPTLMSADSTVQLTGHVNGDYERAYWTDELGQNAEMYGADAYLDWYCLGPGAFTISLVAVMRDGSHHQDTHEIQCV